MALFCYRGPVKTIVRGLAAVSVLGIAGVIIVGEFLSKPVHAAIGAAPAGLHGASVRFESPAGAIAGWLIPGRPGGGAVLLLHGVRGSRLAMLARARFLSKRGFAVLLIDMPAHGESGGERMTFGGREAEGARAALAFLTAHCPGEKIGVIGQSLGAASLVLALPQPAPAAVVLESMYPTIEEAVANRLHMRLGTAGTWLAPLLLRQLPLRTGIAPAALRPIEVIGAMTSPIMIMAGNRDLDTTAAETQRIYDAVRAPKSLWMVDGAAHVDLHAFAPEEYEKRVGAFLSEQLQQGDSKAVSRV
jgi:fermentation-respiration switch protein FrsA (DUF1100 family)